MNKPANLKSQPISDSFEENCRLYNLTSREKDIAALIREGHTYKEIGETLFSAESRKTCPAYF